MNVNDKKKLVLIDDSPGLLEALRFYFDKKGYIVGIVCNKPIHNLLALRNHVYCYFNKTFKLLSVSPLSRRCANYQYVCTVQRVQHKPLGLLPLNLR